MCWPALDFLYDSFVILLEYILLSTSRILSVGSLLDFYYQRAFNGTILKKVGDECVVGVMLYEHKILACAYHLPIKLTVILTREIFC